MIICKDCKSSFLEKITKTQGINVHSVLDGNKLVVSSEFIKRTGQEFYILTCRCKKHNWRLLCDECQTILEDPRTYEVLPGYNLVLCDDCAKDKTKMVPIKIEDLEIYIALNLPKPKTEETEVAFGAVAGSVNEGTNRVEELTFRLDQFRGFTPASEEQLPEERVTF